jgi:hypothetical protein
MTTPSGGEVDLGVGVGESAEELSGLGVIDAVQMLAELAADLLPEVDEAQDFVALLPFA